ncbi:MAG: 2-oxoglutarate dehydrogenase E1 component [Bacteroidota bacterium]
MATNYSYLSNADPKYIDEMYQQYQADPESVEYGWQKFFEGFDLAKTDFLDADRPEGEAPVADVKEIYVLNLINAYRTRGHLFTKSNPVRDRRTYSPTLALKNFGLSEADLDTKFTAGVDLGIGRTTLREIVSMLETTYCASIGCEFMYIRETEILNWLKYAIENDRNIPVFSLDKKKHILHKLTQAVNFEKFLGMRYVGQKRFSIEGGETLIPALDEVIEKGAELGIEEFIIGMAHRGRLNVLANIMGKPYKEVFAEFEEFMDEDEAEEFLGDVKYHHGYSFDVTTEIGKTVHLSLTPNPSHLEAVGPVAQGKARAKIDVKHGQDHNKLATILIHGDAAVAAQGVVYELVQMSELPPYEAGGTIHIVINNQVGFTTNYIDARTSTYCTDVAKVTNSPVFHVNGDDVEAVVYTCKLAMDFRQKFNRDVFIDLLCYRRHGHNEGDEPRFTQPILYDIIAKHPDPLVIYAEKLKEAGTVDAGLAKQMAKVFKKELQELLTEVKQNGEAVEYSFMQSIWKELREHKEDDWNISPETGVAEEQLRPLAEAMITLPEGKGFYDKTYRIFDQRKKQLAADRLDWSMGELLAYATLLTEGSPVRLTGQDVERGTFAHRHAVLKIAETEEEYTPLNHLREDQAQLQIHNSLLSEYAVLGFEYGYSWSAPYTLTMWEAQFGDFVNGAQIMIDQFIASAEQKWRRLSGLVMLLPHGYEGQGPEHSSARMERFLELCSGNNWQIVQPTTPAQMFHMLRRQMHREFRVPLVVFTPKSLLRLPQATSKLSEMTSGRFQEVIDDATAKPESVKRVLMCSGKIYYELLKRRDEEERADIAIVRVEQLYPLPQIHLDAIQERYTAAEQWFWVQDEPENMGPWPFVLRKYRQFPFEVISRRESSSPATGYKKAHTREQQQILDLAFSETKTSNTKSKELVS